MLSYFGMPSKQSRLKVCRGLKFVLAQGEKVQGNKVGFGLGSNCTLSITQFMVRNDKYLWWHAYLLSNTIKVFNVMGLKCAVIKVSLARCQIVLDLSLNWYNKHLGCHAYLLSHVIKVFSWPMGIMGSKFARDQSWLRVNLRLITLSIDGSEQ